MSGKSSPDKFNIILRGETTARTFSIAQGSEGEPMFEMVGSGRDLKESWDFRLPSNGMGETVRYSPTSNGEHFTVNMDTTSRGIRLSPSINGDNNASLSLTGLPSSGLLDDSNYVAYAEETAGTGVTLIYIRTPISTTVVRTWKVRGETGAEIAAGQYSPTYTASDRLQAGRYERFDGITYECTYTPNVDVNSLEGLTTITATTDTRTSIDDPVNVTMLLREESGTGGGTTTNATTRLLRGLTSNQLQSVNSEALGDGPLDNANWAPSPGHEIGDVTAIITGGASIGGLTFVAKTDGLYTTDQDGNYYSVITFVSRMNADRQNGFGTIGYGDRCFYPSEQGLWRVIDISRAQLIGPDAIPGYTRTPQTAISTSAMPHRLRHYELAYYGKWIYALYGDPTGSNTYILAGTIERHPDTGFEMKWYTLIRRTETLRGLFVDSLRQLRTVDLTTGREHVFKLALDGSPDSTADGRGAPDDTADWVGPQVDFGEPEVLKQLRWAWVEVENGVSTADWRIQVYRDGGAGATLGLTFDGVTADETSPVSRNWTVGTNDTCYKVQFGLRCITSASYDETAGDPKILSLVVHARTADIWKVVLTDTGDSRMNLFDVAKLLRKSKDAGPVTIREPGTNETHTAYVKQVNDVLYSTTTGQARGVEVIYERFAVAV